MTHNLEPDFTLETTRQRFELPEGSVYIYGARTDEERAIIDRDWKLRQEARDVRFFAVTIETPETIELVEEATGKLESFLLHDQAALQRWFSSKAGTQFVDITALALRTWAPLLRALIAIDVAFRFVYVEPQSYRRSLSPASGLEFELSEVTEGLSAIPGFARLTEDEGSVATFVPMLGFEGSRLRRVVKKLEIDPAITYPIVGVPGFRAHYPFFAYEGNQHDLGNGFVHARVHLARANCPFDAFFELDRLHQSHAATHIKIAPLGTKPHALGAVLFALARGAEVELLYDHPVRAPRPTNGSARMCIFFVSDFVSTDLFVGGAKAIA